MFPQPWKTLGRSLHKPDSCIFPCRLPHLARGRLIHCLSFHLNHLFHLFSGRDEALDFYGRFSSVWWPSSQPSLHLSRGICTTAIHRVVGQCLHYVNSQHFSPACGCGGLSVFITFKDINTFGDTLFACLFKHMGSICSFPSSINLLDFKLKYIVLETKTYPKIY